MSKKMHRGFVATLATGALVLSLAPTAFADHLGTVDDDDGSPVVVVPEKPQQAAETFRIADSTPILTAIEASQSRNDWGRGSTNNPTPVFDCSVASFPLNGQPVPDWTGLEVGDIFYPFLGIGSIECEVVLAGFREGGRVMDIIVSRDDVYADGLAAAPLADVLDAPILLNPSNRLDPAVAAEIERLAALVPAGGVRPNVTVHLLGGTNALSDSVNQAIRGLDGVDRTLRYQGIDRYETATTIARATVDRYGIESEAGLRDINAYLTTGINFPDALSAGAAAANNDGIVLLTAGDDLDRRGFTEDFLIELRNLVNDPNRQVNTTENFAVGGPAARAADTYDIRLAPDGAYVGSDRFETATITAEKGFGNPSQFAVVSGMTFQDALVAGGYIANLDGPLLLTRPDSLTPVTAEYLFAAVDNGDRVFTFGGPYSLKLAVTDQIVDLLELKFEQDPET